MVKRKQKLHAEKGFGQVIMKFELVKRIDALKLPGESRPSVISRLLELAEGVNTRETPPKVSTPPTTGQKKAGMTLEEAVELVQKRKKGKNPRKG